MKDLDQRIRVLIAKLSMLSEASSQQLDQPRIARPHSESRPPKGVQPDRKGKPDPDDSLLHYFLEGLERATSRTRKVALVAEVEIRLAKRCDGKVQRATAGAINTAAPVDSDERDHRIAKEYTGFEPAEVAAIETEAYGWCPPANVRKVRIQHKRNPETGEPRPDSSEKQYALELRREGVSIGSIALRVGKPKSTVQYWLKDSNGEGRAA